MRRFSRIALTAAVVAGCSKSPAPSPNAASAAVVGAMISHQAAQHGEQIGAGAAANAYLQMAKMAQQPPKRGIINFKKLTPLLPDAPAGWTAAPAEGRTMAVGAFQVSEASRRYQKGTESITLKVTDLAGNPMMATLPMAFAMQEETSNGYRKPFTLAGDQGSEHWQVAGKQAEIQLLTKNQLLVSANGSGLDGTGAAKDLLAKVDIAKVEALAP